MKKASNILKAIIIAIIFLIILTFAFQNLETVNIDFLTMESIDIPLFIILFGILFLGILIGYLFGLISGSKVEQVKIDKINIKANEKIAEAEAKIVSMNEKMDEIKTIQKK